MRFLPHASGYGRGLFGSLKTPLQRDVSMPDIFFRIHRHARFVFRPNRLARYFFHICATPPPPHQISNGASLKIDSLPVNIVFTYYIMYVLHVRS